MEQANLTNNQMPVGSSAPKAVMIQKITGVFDLIGGAWEIYKKRFWKFIGMMLVPILGTLPLVVILIVFGLTSFIFKEAGIALNIINVLLGLLGIVAVIFFIVVMVCAQAGLYILVKSSEELTIKAAFLEGKKYAWRFFAINFLVAIFVLLWAILLIIPGIIAAIYYTFASWFLFDKGEEALEAIKKSKNLVKGYWWAVFGRLVAIQVMLMVITSLPSIIFQAVKVTELQILWSIVSNVISFLAAPFILIYAYSMYKDLKSIKGE